MLTLTLFCLKDNSHPFPCDISFLFFVLLQVIYCMHLVFMLVFLPYFLYALFLYALFLYIYSSHLFEIIIAELLLAFL